MIKVTLKGGVIREYEAGTTIGEVAASLGAGLAKAACCARLDGETADLRDEINSDCSLEICTFEDMDGKKAFWHSASHVLAQAVRNLYPQVKLAIGPAIDSGFYYDFDVPTPFTAADLEKLEAEMKKIAKDDPRFERFSLPVSEALELMKDEPYKLELINELAEKGEDISFYRQGSFTDLCAGPHLRSAGIIKAVKLLTATGAYWRGSEKNKMLCRVYGVAFPKASELEAHLNMLEEAKRRDHRKLGRELELFILQEEGPGFPFFLPKGMIIKNLLLDYWRELHKEAGYQEISTPIILNQELWLQSGHWDHYKGNMYITEIDEKNYCVKPMNCPGGMLVYQSKMRSYRDFPLRMAEIGLVHRHELSGALHGLMRVRCFNQDDAHIYMTNEQVKDEIKNVITLIDKVYGTFGFDFHIELSTRPENFMGEIETWDVATDALREAITELGREYVLNEGDGAFYGPKLDFHLRDCLGRTWQCGTIQLDFQMPERFKLEYVGSDNAKHRPVMLHRTVLGSVERFIGILIEHFAGAMPLWLSPTQVAVMPIADRQLEYAQGIVNELKQAGIRVSLDDRQEKIGYKIREAQLQKIPYMLVIGDKEMEGGLVAVRSRSGGDMGAAELGAFIEKAREEIAAKTNA